jgi:hypothetical protein
VEDFDPTITQRGITQVSQCLGPADAGPGCQKRTPRCCILCAHKARTTGFESLKTCNIDHQSNAESAITRTSNHL